MRDFELVITDINGLDPIPDVIVHTGDIVHDGDPQEYAPAWPFLRKRNLPSLSWRAIRIIARICASRSRHADTLRRSAIL
jgi:3',5'-cyclic AMP phosphodiesterase CpdA